MDEESGICRLPEGCIAHILSLTSPPESLTAAAVSSTFRSAADSDAVWEKFLPSDYREIISRAEDEVTFSSRKELFARLCCRPLLVDGGRKSFMLDRFTGKKCYMLSPRMLHITWGESPNYWKWTSLPDSRFSEIAKLKYVCWLHITGYQETAELSPKTTYVAYLIFKLSRSHYGFDDILPNASITIGTRTSTRTVTLQTSDDGQSENMFWGTRIFRNMLSLSEPQEASETQSEAEHVGRERSDGWMELKLGEFFNEDGHDGEVAMSLYEHGGHWKRGLFVGGIELRPKS